jgi:hypothetical protein
MGLQCAALIAIFVVLQASPDGDILPRLRDGLLYAMVGATALSGAQYLWKAFLLLK